MQKIRPIPLTQALPPEWFARDPISAAREIIGHWLVVGRCAGIIVETEAYGDDSASHARTRPHAAGALMATYGRIYTYRIHTRTCLNITAGRNRPGAVLIRAVEPQTGLDTMAARRRKRLRHLHYDPARPASLKILSSGPGRLCEAFAVTMKRNGQPVGKTIKILPPQKDEKTRPVTATPRIGISRATALPWRFIAPDSPLLSRT
jgi:DNA-3-methyladenine glycosylase